MSDSLYETVAIWSDVVSAILFVAVLVWMWNKFLTPAILASQERKNAELAEAERRRDTAKDDAVLAQSQLASADGDVRSIGERAARDVAAVGEKIVSEARAEGERLIRNAGGELERSRSAARDRLREELVARALEIARSAAGKLDEKTNARLVGDVVDSLERSER